MGDWFDVLPRFIDAGSALVTNIFNRGNVNRTNEAQKEIAAENTALSREMNIYNNEFNAAEAEKARQFQLAQWSRENEYNSPVNQAARLREAGINPQVAMSSSVGSAASTGNSSGLSSSPSASAAGGFQASTPNLQPFIAQTIQPARLYADYAQAMANVGKAHSESALTDAQRDSLLGSMKDNWRKIKADATAAEIEKDFAPFRNQMQYLESGAQYFALLQQANVYASQFELNKAESALKQAQTISEGWKSKELQIIAETASARIAASINEAKSRAAANYANAAKTGEETSQLRDMHNDIVAFQKYSTDQKFAESEVVSRTINEQIAHWKNINLESQKSREERDAKIAELEKQLSLMEEARRNMEKRNQSYWFDKAVDTAVKINDGFNKWAPWAFSRETQYEDNDGNISVSRTSYSR